jgi:hypothetical protein
MITTASGAFGQYVLKEWIAVIARSEATKQSTFRFSSDMDCFAGARKEREGNR